MVELEEEAVCQRLGCRITDVTGGEAVLSRYGPLTCTQANVGNMQTRLRAARSPCSFLSNVSPKHH